MEQHKLLSPEELKGAQWIPVARVARLLLYPVKSCGPLELEGATAGQAAMEDPATGLKDREYMVALAKGPMVTGRMCPQLVQTRPSLEGGALRLAHPQGGEVLVEEGEAAPQRSSVIWGDEVSGSDCGEAAAAWLSSLLRRQVRLLRHCGPASRRPTRLTHPEPTPLFREGDGALYSDLTPYMLLGAASLERVGEWANRSLDPVQMRPNIVVESLPGAPPLPPFAEDGWGYIRVGGEDGEGGAVFRNIKPCTRCIFTTIDPAKGVKDPEKEPLNTLKKQRMRGAWDSPLLGVGLALERGGGLRVGDTVWVAEPAPPPPPPAPAI